jgi:hypothetical protein
MRNGLSNREIAGRMGISLSGAKHHVSEILGKLGVASREEAAAWKPGRSGLAALVPTFPEFLKHIPWRVGVAALAVSAGLLLGVLAIGLMARTRNSPHRSTGDTDSVQALSQEARAKALDFAPDADLRQIDADAETSGVTFRFVSLDDSSEIDVTARPGEPSRSWQVVSNSTSALLQSSSLPLSLAAVDVSWEDAAVLAQGKSIGCVPKTAILADQGDGPGWYVYCQSSRVGTLLWAFDATKGASLLDSTPPAQPLLDTAPDWSLAHLVSRQGRVLSLRLDETGEAIEVDLLDVAIFDCRMNCFYTNGLLGPVNATSEFCIGWLGVRDGHQDGMLWVDRYTCDAGGRVIPPP